MEHVDDAVQKMLFLRGYSTTCYHFQMFLCVVVFGLFHGILLLPVLLSLMGSHSEHDEDQLEDMVRSLFESFSIFDDSCP